MVLVMRKSKYLFAVISVVYACVGLLNMVGALRVGTNIFAALSITALFISLGDIFEKIYGYLYNRNLIRAEKKVDIDFLNSKLESGVLCINLNIRNAIENIKEDDIAISKYEFCHPAEYTKKRHMKAINIISITCFIIGIAVFIILPLIITNIFSEKMISVISLFAFSVMMMGMHVDEKILDIQMKYNSLVIEKSAIIRGAFCDFDAYHGQFFMFFNDLKAQGNIGKENEENLNNQLENGSK